MAGAPKGNQNAKGRKQKLFDDALRRAIAQDDKDRLRRAAESLLEQAAAGEQWAIREIADRLDGKPKQAVVGGDEDDNPIRITRIELVAMNADSQD